LYVELYSTQQFQNQHQYTKLTDLNSYIGNTRLVVVQMFNSILLPEAAFRLKILWHASFLWLTGWWGVGSQ